MVLESCFSARVAKPAEDPLLGSAADKGENDLAQGNLDSPKSRQIFAVLDLGFPGVS
jgi:hypothetical protein